jgi:hypothetical protein
MGFFSKLFGNKTKVQPPQTGNLNSKASRLDATPEEEKQLLQHIPDREKLLELFSVSRSFRLLRLFGDPPDVIRKHLEGGGTIAGLVLGFLKRFPHPEMLFTMTGNPSATPGLRPQTEKTIPLYVCRHIRLRYTHNGASAFFGIVHVEPVFLRKGVRYRMGNEIYFPPEDDYFIAVVGLRGSAAGTPTGVNWNPSPVVMRVSAFNMAGWSEDGTLSVKEDVAAMFQNWEKQFQQGVFEVI